MNNIFQMMQTIKNPQVLVQQVMNNNQIMQNPIANSAVDMYRRGDKDGLDKLVGNLCKEKGIDQREVENNIKSMFGIK